MDNYRIYIWFFPIIKYIEWLFDIYESDELSYYNSYVNHMMRLYYKTDGKDLRTDVNRLNYNISKNVIESYTEFEQAILTDILLPIDQFIKMLKCIHRI